MTWLLSLLVLTALLVWLFRPGNTAPEPGEEREPVDADELEAAEREVRDLDLHQKPDDGFEGDDWGPGTSKK